MPSECLNKCDELRAENEVEPFQIAAFIQAHTHTHCMRLNGSGLLKKKKKPKSNKEGYKSQTGNHKPTEVVKYRRPPNKKSKISKNGNESLKS